MPDEKPSIGLFDAAEQVLSKINNAEISGAIKRVRGVEFVEVNTETPLINEDRAKIASNLIHQAVDNPDVMFSTVAEFKKRTGHREIEFCNPHAIVAWFAKPDGYQSINLNEALERADFLKTNMLQAWSEPSSAKHKAYKISLNGSPGDTAYFSTVKEAEASTKMMNSMLDNLTSFHGSKKFRGSERVKTIELNTGRYATAIPRATLAAIQKLEGLAPGCEVKWCRGE